MSIYTVNKHLLQEVIVPPDDPADLMWQDKALCAQVDAAIFFPEKGESTRPAKLVCRGCEVRAECLEYALEHADVSRFGIWGGMSERERRRLKPQPAATTTTPRKAAAA